MLTFGGKIIELLNANEDVTVHLVFGTDGYMRPTFRQSLINQETDTINYIRDLGHQSGNQDIVEQILATVQGIQYAHTNLGILVRTLEERACSKSLGFKLVEYSYPCAYPLRGYVQFNENHPLDVTTQTQILEDELIIPISQTNSDHANYYFPSGVGGHGDHLVLAHCGIRLSNAVTNKVFFGQDLPYASVMEWIQFSPLSLPAMKKEITDLTDTLKDKIGTLSQFYRSQLSPEDLRVIERFHQALAQLMHREYYNQLSTKRLPNSIECSYYKDEI